MTQYVLDSWALVCWFRNEPAAPRVTKLFDAVHQRSCMLSISVINLGEALYTLARYRGLAQAQQDMAAMRKRLQVLPVSEDLVMRAAALKAAHTRSPMPMDLRWPRRWSWGYRWSLGNRRSARWHGPYPCSNSTGSIVSRWQRQQHPLAMRGAPEGGVQVQLR